MAESGSLTYAIGTMRSEDIPDVLHLLTTCGLAYPEDDTPQSFRRKHQTDERLMVVARSSERRIIGFVMASYDGWCALVWHLCVQPEWRDLGIGRELMEAISSRLRDRGATLVYGLVKTENDDMFALCKHLGLTVGPDVRIVCGQL